MKPKTIILLLLALITFPVLSQNNQVKVTDSNTALHALPPDYPVPYKPIKTEEVTEVLNRIFTYLEVSSPAKLVDRQTKAEVTDLTKINGTTMFEQGVFRPVSYEWGVTYGAMLLAGGSYR